MGCHFLLQGIFPTQGSNPGLPHCRQTLYRLSHQGSQGPLIAQLVKEMVTHSDTRAWEIPWAEEPGGL